MQLKFDDDGNVVLQDGNPVYVYEDGKESPFDAKATLENYERRIANLEEEKDRHFKKTQDLKKSIKTFDGIDPVKARDALDTVQNLKDQQILDAQGVKALKTEMREIFNNEKQDLVKQHEAMVAEKSKDIESLERTIHEMVIAQQFHSSAYFTGERPKTLYPPNDAAKIFGHHFDVTRGEDGYPRVIAKDVDGKTILSRKKHGDPATFDEAMGIIIENHPEKNRFLMSPDGSGPGSHGNMGRNGDDSNLHGAQAIAAGLRKRRIGR